MHDLLIVCAGKQSRFASTTPKALVGYRSTTLLEYNVQQLQHTFCINSTYVICNEQNVEHFEPYRHLAYPVVTYDNKGTGDTIKKAVEFTKSKHALVVWGDALFRPQMLEQVAIYSSDVVVPVARRQKPYVNIETDKETITGVQFGKYNEVNAEWGYQDMSMFFINDVQKVMNTLDEELYDTCISKYGELDFLNVLPKVHSKVCQVRASPNSFNTVEELRKVWRS